MLLPGDRGLAAPAAPPYLPFQCMQAYNPIIGPKAPEEECMHDGGDVGLKATIINGELHGLDPSDTVAEYTDVKGERRVTVSNRICLCVPRFAVLRTEIAPADYSIAEGPSVSRTGLPPYDIHARVPPQTEANAQPPVLAQVREKPNELKEVEGPIIIDKMETPAIVIGTQEGHVVVGTLKQVCVAPAVPLKLCKSSDKVAEIGDIATFTLKYTNPGGQPINDVVVSDSSTGRLEYVLGTEKSDRDAVFTDPAERGRLANPALASQVASAAGRKRHRHLPGAHPLRSGRFITPPGTPRRTPALRRRRGGSPSRPRCANLGHAAEADADTARHRRLQRQMTRHRPVSRAASPAAFSIGSGPQPTRWLGRSCRASNCVTKPGKPSVPSSLAVRPRRRPRRKSATPAARSALRTP